MGAYFEYVNRYKDTDLPLPNRGTKDSAGYDMYVMEDTIIPSHLLQLIEMKDKAYSYTESLTLAEMADYTKKLHIRPTLVSSGVKCHLDSGTYLELSVRSSTPLKHWLILANSVGVIDADYYNNPDNEGEIMFQLINLSPWEIKLKKGDRIGQGIIKPYLTTENDAALGERLGGFGSTT